MVPGRYTPAVGRKWAPKVSSGAHKFVQFLEFGLFDGLKLAILMFYNIIANMSDNHFERTANYTQLDIAGLIVFDLNGQPDEINDFLHLIGR